MFLRFLCLLMFIGLFAACNNQKKNNNVAQDSKIYSLRDAFDLQGEAMKAFNTEPQKAAQRFLVAATAYIQNGYHKDAGICYGNAAHLYEEQFNQLDSAYLLSKLGLEYSIKGNDTLNTGHGYRYTGYLMGMNNRIDEGIKEIEKAKPYYRLRNNNDAIAVADFDMARVYFHGKIYDKAMESFTKSTDHFKNKMNLQRIFNNNLFALKMYKTSGNKAAYDSAKSENDNLIQNGKIGEPLKLKYYEVLKQFSF